ncbi:uncharacterized protein N7443_000095 [Penicillium atrosanguineum]|uniref:uncharacterized protein n=1 Tax=Penicillium atrosanguineum TaxID=1132637 RepID=UPI002399ACA8|nr:uncharacterized protein N7443_000095 [Penicillium atrosanguineum]KAJ5313211.1 hypothetical protein N7443_000095 [Penicillium atrosanguineum]
MKWKEADWEAWEAALAEAISETQPATLVTSTDDIDKDTAPVSRVSQYSIYAYSEELADLKRRASQARRWAKVSGDEADTELFNRLRHELGRAAAKAARAAHRHRVEGASEDINGRAQSGPLPPIPEAKDTDDIRVYEYLQPLQAPAITTHEVANAIHRAAPFNAPGPDGIPSAALKHAIKVPRVLTIITILFNESLYHGYCPQHFHRSGTEIGVGAAATTSRGNSVAVISNLQTHTVYAAELEGASSGQHIVYAIADLIQQLREIGYHIRIRWVPGNERADKLANTAANSTSTARSALPAATVLVSSYRTILHEHAFEQWKRQWASSPHGSYTRAFFPNPTKAIFDIHQSLKRPASSALVQMQTGKIGLRAYLNTIKQWREEQLGAKSLRNPKRCNACDLGNQDTQHVLLTYPRFAELRLQVLGLSREIDWKDWLTQPDAASKAATFILKTTLLGQFRALPNTFQATRAGACDYGQCHALLALSGQNYYRRLAPISPRGCGNERWSREAADDLNKERECLGN